MKSFDLLRTGGAAAGAKNSPGSNWQVLFATWLGEMFDGMDASIFVITLFPAMSDLLGTESHSTVGLYGSIVMATFMTGWAIGAVLFGILSDYIGRTRTMMMTILLYAIFTGFCAISHNWVELACYRFFVGCGIGGEISVGGIIIAECWRGNSRLHATGVMMSSFGFGYLAAAFLNLWLGSLGWRLLFLVGVVPALLTLYIRAKIKEPEHFQVLQEYKRRLRSRAKTELTPDEVEVLRFTFPQIFTREYRKKIAIIAGLASTAIVGYWAALAWIPPWINQITGTQAVMERSMAAIVMNVGAIVGSLFAGTLVVWFGRRNCFRLAFAGAFFCCALMFLTVKEYGPILLAWSFGAGFFAVVPFSFVFIYAPELFDSKIRGTAFGFSVQIGRVLAAIAALAGGQLIHLFGGSYALAGACVAGCYLLGICVTYLMPQSNGEVSLVPNADVNACSFSLSQEEFA